MYRAVTDAAPSYGTGQLDRLRRADEYNQRIMQPQISGVAAAGRSVEHNNCAPVLLLVLQVMAAVVQVHQDISKASNRLKRHTDSWKKYSDIWKADRVSLLDKFRAKAPPTPAFEEKFAKFQKVGASGWLH